MLLLGFCLQTPGLGESGLSLKYQILANLFSGQQDIIGDILALVFGVGTAGLG